MLVLIARAEDTFHSFVGQPVKRLLEQRVRFGPLELKKIEISFGFIKMEAIDSIVIASKCHLSQGLFAVDAELIRYGNQPK